MDTAELSDSNDILNITEASPYQLVRLRTKPGKTVSDVKDGDLTFSNYNKNFNISVPTDAFNLDDPIDLPAVLPGDGHQPEPLQRRSVQRVGDRAELGGYQGRLGFLHGDLHSDERRRQQYVGHLQGNRLA